MRILTLIVEICIIELLRNLGPIINLAPQLTATDNTIYKRRILLSNRQCSLEQVLERGVLSISGYRTNISATGKTDVGCLFLLLSSKFKYH